MNDVAIERLPRAASEADVRDLAALLVDAVDSGAAVSFLAPLAPEKAAEWWRGTLSGSHAKAVFLVARDSGRVVGTVQLHPAWAPNQPHRAEIAKLMVHRSARGRGVAEALMRAAEAAAKEAGYTLLTLDAKEDAPAVRLYRKLGWTEVGVIPRYALDPDGGAYHGTVIFYKDVR